MRPPLTIVGGGLAGLSLGIGLRQKDVPVTILEAGQYPRHKVCGEFISGRGQDVLHRLGLRDCLAAANAVPARTAAFFSLSAKSKPRPLRPPALCLSRFKLDNLLAEEFRKLGGDLRERHRVNTPGGLAGNIVHATGRRPQTIEKGWRWFGIKVHAKNICMESDLEMHVAPQGYIGLCRLADDIVNVCGLFRSRPGTSQSPARWKSMLSATQGMPLHEVLTKASFDESSFCAIAGLGLSPARAKDCNECRIGDAVTMIPPVTGNGMSMAFESAELAIAPLVSYHEGALSWQAATRAIATACDNAFGRRLRWAGFLQWMMFAPLLRGSLGFAALKSDWLWRVMFGATR